MPGGLHQLEMTAYINDLTHYLSIDCFLKASSHMSVLTEVRSDMAMTISIGVWVPAAMFSGGVMYIPRLGALLD